MELEKVGSCVIIRMKLGKNVFNSEFVDSMNEALDKALKYEDARAVVTTGDGKFYSYGVSLDIVKSTDTAFSEIIERLQQLILRLVTFPVVTVAAINGHSFGAGAFLALAHDHRVMRRDRGWFCLPAVQYKKTLPVGLLKLIRSCIPPPHNLTSLVYGKQYTAQEAKAAGIVQESSSLEELEKTAIAAAGRLAGSGPALDRKTVSTLKHDLYYDICQSLSEPVKLHSKL